MAWPKTVRKEDIRIDYYRSGGAGGQHKNKTDSAVRMTHLKTGIVAQADEQRSQIKNKRIAFLRLTEKLIPLMKQAAQVNPDQNFQSAERIRTYHEPRQQVKDHRSGKTYTYSDIIDGQGLDELIVNVMQAKAAKGAK